MVRTLCVLTAFVVSFVMGADAPNEQPTVVCPVDLDGRARTNYPGEAMRPIELVVLGTCKRVDGDNGFYDITVQEVLYGEAPKTIRCKSFRGIESDKPRLYALVPCVYDDGAAYDFKYSLPENELAAIRSLSAARFDFTVLSADSIFVGKELEADNRYQRKVRVIRHIAGEFKPTNVVTIFDGGYTRWANTPKVRDGERIYFITGTKTVHADEDDMESPSTVLPDLHCCLPAGREA